MIRGISDLWKQVQNEGGIDVAEAKMDFILADRRARRAGRKLVKAKAALDQRLDLMMAQNQIDQRLREELDATIEQGAKMACDVIDRRDGNE